MTTRAALQPSLKSVRQKIPPNASSLDLVTKISQHSNFRYFRHHFDSTFPRNPSKPMFRCFQRRRLCDDVFSILADEFGDFRAVFGTALKERNRTIGYKKHGGISACRKAFYLLRRWIFKENTEEIWSWLFFTTWICWILNFIIKFDNVLTSTSGILDSNPVANLGLRTYNPLQSAPVQLATVG